MSLESRLAEVSTDLKNVTNQLAEVRRQQTADHDAIVVLVNAKAEADKKGDQGWQAKLAILIAVVGFLLSLLAAWLTKR